MHAKSTKQIESQGIITDIRFWNSLLEESIADLNEAVRLAPAGRDVMVSKVLLKAKEETETAFRQSQSNEEMETSKTWTHDKASLSLFLSLSRKISIVFSFLSFSPFCRFLLISTGKFQRCYNK